LDAAVRDGGVSLRQLQCGDVESVAERNRGLDEVAPGTWRRDVAAHLARKAAAGAGAESELVQHAGHLLRRQRQRNLRRAHIAGNGDHAADVDQAIVAVVADQMTVDRERAGAGVDRGGRRPLARLQRGGDRNGFMVEPGSVTSVTARLRRCAELLLSRSLGLYDGTLTIARISPLRGSRITIEPDAAWRLTTASVSAW